MDQPANIHTHAQTHTNTRSLTVSLPYPLSLSPARTQTHTPKHINTHTQRHTRAQTHTHTHTRTQTHTHTHARARKTAHTRTRRVCSTPSRGGRRRRRPSPKSRRSTANGNRCSTPTRAGSSTGAGAPMRGAPHASARARTHSRTHARTRARAQAQKPTATHRREAKHTQELRLDDWSLPVPAHICAGTRLALAHICAGTRLAPLPQVCAPVRRSDPVGLSGGHRRRRGRRGGQAPAGQGWLGEGPAGQVGCDGNALLQKAMPHKRTAASKQTKKQANPHRHTSKQTNESTVKR